MAADDGGSRLRDRLGRAARLGVGAARSSAGWAVGSLLEAAGRRDGATRTWRSASARAAASLGEMKGLAMKVGQYVSFALPDLPPELRDALAVLQTSAPQRPFEEIAAVIELRWASPWTRLSGTSNARQSRRPPSGRFTGRGSPTARR